MISRRRLHSCATRVYRAAMIVVPRDIRARYACEMEATFDERSRDAAAKGVMPIAALLRHECVDLVRARLTRQPQAIDFVHEQRRSPLSALIHDIRYACRMLYRQPAFTATAVVTLALGIGATTAIFTVVNGVLLRPLPYLDPQRLVMLLQGEPGRLLPWSSPPNYYDIIEGVSVFQDTAAFTTTTANFTGDGDPERVEGARVSWNYFNVLGVRMAEGRGFVEDEGRGGGDVIVLSDALWRRRFGARTTAIGSTAMLDGRAYTIVGIAPPAVRLPATAEFWRPLIFQPSDVAPNARGAVWIMAVGRLRDGVTENQAATAVAAVAERLAREYPKTNGGTIAAVTPLQERIVRNVRPTLLLLFGAVTLVLAVACVNVANLLLARAHARHHEVAVRTALGASRSRIIAQFLVESLLLAVLGGAAGCAVAYACLQALAALAPASIPRLYEIAIDGRTLAFALLTSLATSVLFGIAPALSVSRVARWLASARGSVGPAGATTRRALVAAEIALAVVLLVGAGLLLRSYDVVQRVSPGFDPDGVTTFNLSLPETKYATPVDVDRFVTTLMNRLAAQPDVQSAAAAFGLPFSSGFSAHTSFRRGAEPDAADNPRAAMRVVTPDYFRTLRIPLVAGRVFDSRDVVDSPEVVIVNRQTARRFFGGENPLGKQIKIGVRLVRVRSEYKTIVGVVGDVKYGGLDEDAPAEVYLPHAQHPVDSFTVAIRGRRDTAALGPMLRREVASLDTQLPLEKLQPMTSLVDASFSARRFVMLLLVSFAGVAVVLAAVGVYGVLAFIVTQRTREIGVRLAMGASPRDVVRLIVREGAALALAGLIAGFVGALAAGRTLATMLFGVTPQDPATFAGVAIALTAAALAASYVPARRAARVEPMEALRVE
jgi:putative ABC transport system permease protein